MDIKITIDKFESCIIFFFIEIFKSANLKIRAIPTIIKNMGPLINIAIRLVMIKKIYE